MGDLNTGDASAPERIITDDEYTKVTKGEAKDIPPYMGIGANIEVMTHGDMLLINASEPGFSKHWVGRIQSITDLEAENARLRAQVGRLQDAFIGLAEDNGDTFLLATEYNLPHSDLDPLEKQEDDDA